MTGKDGIIIHKNAREQTTSVKRTGDGNVR